LQTFYHRFNICASSFTALAL